MSAAIRLKTSVNEAAPLPERARYAIDIVAQELVRRMEVILDALRGNAAPLGEERLDPEAQVAQYYAIATAPDGWLKFFEDVRTQLEEALAGISPTERAKYSLSDEHVRSIAVLAAIEYRDQMEKRIRKGYRSPEGLPTDAQLPPEEGEVTEVDPYGNSS